MNMLNGNVTVRRLIQAEQSRVFDAFSTSNALSKWFSPSPDIRVDIKTFEFNQKGKFRVCYTMPDGSTPAANGMFEVIDRPGEIVFTWRWEVPDPHADISTRVSIQLLDKGGSTEVVLTHEKLPLEAHTRHAEGWKATLERLEPFLTSKSIFTTPSDVTTP